MFKSPTISNSRFVQIYRDVLSCRREHHADKDFFKMTDVWSQLTDSGSSWRIKFFSSNLGDSYRRKAGVVAFGDIVTLTVDRELWKRAESGELFSGFMLAHELGHVALGHHTRHATTKNFKLAQSSSGMYSIIPPNSEELEANFAAVIFQCGVALADERWNVVDLAKRARTDIGYVKKTREFLLSPAVKAELHTEKKRYPRVIL